MNAKPRRLNREDKIFALTHLAISRMAHRLHRLGLDEAAELVRAAAFKIREAKNSVGAWRQRAKRA